MPTINPNCTECEVAKIPECFEKVTFDLGLDANANYYTWFIDQFGNRYVSQILTDANGKFEKLDDLKQGIFSQHSESIELFITKEKNENCTRENLTVCGVQTDCFSLEFVGTNEEEQELEIPCCDE